MLFLFICNSIICSSSAVYADEQVESLEVYCLKIKAINKKMTSNSYT